MSNENENQDCFFCLPNLFPDCVVAAILIGVAIWYFKFRNATRNEILVKKIVLKNKFESLENEFEKISVPEDNDGYHYDSNDLTTKTVRMLNTTNVKDRENLLQQICEAAESSLSTLPTLPVEGSVTTSNEPHKQAVLSAFDEVDVPQQFCDTIPMDNVMGTAQMIENITGYNVITKKQTPMIEMYISSKDLENVNVLQDHDEEIKNAFRKDLAAIYGVKEEEIQIRYAVPGSVKLLFSLPEYANNSTAQSSSLPTFSSILSNLGISSQVNVATKQILPDVQKAKQLLKDYTTPLVISSKSTNSELMTKFGKYLPVLASLSNHLRVVHNEAKGELEIHGSPEAKGNILSYFADLEDSLQGAKIKTVTMNLSSPLQTPAANANALWDFLFNKAKEFLVSNYTNPSHTLQHNTIRINSELKKGCPVGRSFLNALRKLNLDPAFPNEIFKRGLFGYHGTKTPDALASIAHNNLDPGRRSGQAYGTGEYCATDASYSQGGYWGTTHTLFLVFIIKDCPYYKLQTHYVINNPSQAEMYMVPILLATFNNQTPLKIDCQTNVLSQNIVAQNQTNIKWEWWNDHVWAEYGKGQPITDNSQIVLEDSYRQFKSGSGNSQFIMAFVRCLDGRTDYYLIDFMNKIQTNKNTKYIRKIRRLVNGIETWNLFY